MAGLAATTWLQAAASPPEARPERPVKAECREYIAEIEGQLASATWDGSERAGIVTFMPVGLDCQDELDDLLRSGAR